jgi:ribosomal protein S7
MALSAGTAYYFAPTKIETKTEVKEVEVVKETKKEQKHVNTKIVVTEYPDGRKTTETYIVDDSVVFVDKDVEKQVEIVKEKKVENAKPQWNAKVSTSLYPNFNSIYQVDVNRRILGPIFLGVYGRTDKEFGIGVGFEF